MTKQTHFCPTLMKSFFMLLLVIAVAIPQSLLAQEKAITEGISNKNPGTDLWRDVRQREFSIPGTTQIKGVDSGILINADGEKWVNFRNDKLINASLYFLGGMLLVILMIYLFRGRINIEGGLSGKMVFRFTNQERILHWVMAIVFLFLAITGLMLLLGRTVLIPVFGHEIFSYLASASKLGHNFSGPIFLISLILMLFHFVRRNIYEKGDLTWLLKGGGMIGKEHVTGGFFNMGEKTWYWIVILVGMLISITGLILVTPNFALSRWVMELSHILHVAGSIIMITIAIGHMYLGSVGTEGTYEGMKTGYVDIKWAEAHHDRWAAECHDKKTIISADEYKRVTSSSTVEPGQTSSSISS